jgi:hypothetical protein
MEPSAVKKQFMNSSLILITILDAFCGINQRGFMLLSLEVTSLQDPLIILSVLASSLSKHPWGEQYLAESGCEQRKL